jgi:hypothetical protein
MDRLSDRRCSYRRDGVLPENRFPPENPKSYLLGDDWRLRPNRRNLSDDKPRGRHGLRNHASDRCVGFRGSLPVGHPALFARRICAHFHLIYFRKGAKLKTRVFFI